ncbi:MAG TPA: hypothetical protein VN046_02235 [Stenotrophobium sp.]|nr:hypothetical protein [Stenotrophobium sp.]
MNLFRCLIAAVLLALAGVAQAAEPVAVADYLQTLAQVEQARQPVSLQPLFERALAVQDALMEIRPGSDRAYLETLPDADYRALRGRLRGLALSREGAVYAQPDPGALLQLADAHGLPQDRQFFELYRQYWSKDLFPSYMTPRADNINGCVNYGDGTLTELYESWRSYAMRYPQDYSKTVQQNIKDIEDTVALGTCACGNAASVAREESRFIKRFPDSPATHAARSRLHEIRTHTLKLPIACR